MKTIVIGVMPQEQIRARAMAIAKGEFKPKPGTEGLVQLLCVAAGRLHPVLGYSVRSGPARKFAKSRASRFISMETRALETS